MNDRMNENLMVFMRIFKTKLQSKRLFLFITAIDQNVIARPNFKIKDDCWDQLPAFNLESEKELCCVFNTSVFEQLKDMIKEKKYSFLFPEKHLQNNVLEFLGNIQLPKIYFRELEWLKRFGYYYHHSLAVTTLLCKFGLDTRMDEKLLQHCVQASLIQDIGISRLPSTVLFSSSLFREDDKVLIHQHAIVAYLLIGYYSNKNDQVLGQIVLNHHTPEKLDCKHKNNQSNVIQKGINLIHNLDIFDALINQRPFRPAYSVYSAIIFLKQINHFYSLSTDLVDWLEECFNKSGVNEIGHHLIPIHPVIQSHQLN